MLKCSICFAYFNVWNNKTWQFYTSELHQPFNANIVSNDQLLYNKINWTLLHTCPTLCFILTFYGWRNKNNILKDFQYLVLHLRKLQCGHSVLTTNKKMSTWKKSTTLFGSIRERRTLGRLLFQWLDRQRGEYRSS